MFRPYGPSRKVQVAQRDDMGDDSMIVESSKFSPVESRATDSMAHMYGIYCFDWDKQSRSARVLCCSYSRVSYGGPSGISICSEGTRRWAHLPVFASLKQIGGGLRMAVASPYRGDVGRSALDGNRAWEALHEAS